MLFFAVVPLNLSAEEPIANDQIKSGPTPTDQFQPVPTQTDQIKSGPTPTTQSQPVPTQTDQIISGPTPTTQSQPVPTQADQIKSGPTTTQDASLWGSGQAPQYMPLPGQMEKDRSWSDRTGGGMITIEEMLTLSRCIDIALGKNPTVVAAVNTVDVYQSRVGEARAVYYPQVSGQGTADRQRAQLGNFGGGRGQFNEVSAGVVLSQTIFDFGKLWSSVNIAKYNLDTNRSNLNTTQDIIILSVKQTYYGVLQAKRNWDVAVDVIKQFQLHLDQAKGFYDVGTVAKIDVINAEVNLTNAKLSLINTDNALKIAWVNLNNAMGVPDAPQYAIEDNFSFQKYVITLEDATARAFDNRPDLKSAVAQRQAAEENISLQRSGFMPTLTGNADYSLTEYSVPPSQSPESWYVGVTLNIPLFNGFLTSHQVAEAKSNLYVLKANEELVRQQILSDVRQAYLNLQAAEASIPTAELALSQAKENLDIANGRYSAGVGSPIEVSDAFATYITAQASYNNALYSYKIAQANMEKATGVR